MIIGISSLFNFGGEAWLFEGEAGLFGGELSSRSAGVYQTVEF